MLGVSTILGGLTALVGMYLSYHLDIASGASIVLLSALLFAIALGYRHFAATAVANRQAHNTGRE
ncbi:MAG: metal ABC transporter permease [Dehalococcoidia bacterium]